MLDRFSAVRCIEVKCRGRVGVGATIDKLAQDADQALGVLVDRAVQLAFQLRRE